MIVRLILAVGAVVAAHLATGSVRAEERVEATSVAPPAPEAPSAPKSADEPTAKSAEAAPPMSPQADALQKALASMVVGNSDEEHNEQAALAAFYEKRSYVPLWLTATGAINPNTSLVAAEIKRSAEWGLDPRDFPLPSSLEERSAEGSGNRVAPTPETIAAKEIAISLTVLKYGRYARGGRIINPAEQLSSYLDRRPQLLKPEAILEGIATADHADAYLRSLHPQHSQFEKLRQKYLALLTRNKQKSAEAKKLLANMEEWRWMPVDMGEVYVWNNIPEFTQRVVKDGKVIRKEIIVAGETGKQTPIFSRPMRKITFKPTWIVPDSIKVRELWPSLLNGGGLMRQWDLEVRTKEGQPVNWRKINWATADIRTYDVIQVNGPKSVMGRVKFSFPNQHTVFMHDAPDRDRWMFRKTQRTYSHGCMRVANPIDLAKILLREDKGWDANRVTEALNEGPLNNEIPLDHKIPVHMTYFTAFVDDDGKLRTFSDVYGHERRINQALDGKWDQIVKGRDHLAPVELNMAAAHQHPLADDDASEGPSRRPFERHAGGGGFFGSIFGGDSQ